MTYFTEIRATQHYRDHHAGELPWDKVVALLLGSKGARKKGDTYEIERDGCYVLFTVKDAVAYVINAKRNK